jgi:hypothetical protein
VDRVNTLVDEFGVLVACSNHMLAAQRGQALFWIHFTSQSCLTTRYRFFPHLLVARVLDAPLPHQSRAIDERSFADALHLLQHTPASLENDKSKT